MFREISRPRSTAKGRLESDHKSFDVNRIQESTDSLESAVPYLKGLNSNIEFSFVSMCSFELSHFEKIGLKKAEADWSGAHRSKKR